MVDTLKTLKDVEERCTEMFNRWLKSDNEATWNKIILGLRSQGVHLENVAQDIEKMLDDNHVSGNVKYSIYVCASPFYPGIVLYGLE